MSNQTDAPPEEQAPPATGGGRKPRVYPGFSLTGYLGLFGGLALFVAILLIPSISGLSPEGQRVAAVAVLMAVWWMTEALPLPATALLPLALFPLLGVMPAGATAAPYANDIIFLFLAGFLIALGMQRWGLHRRIALWVVSAVGVQPRRLVLGFMLATGFLSMWMSNTATAAMMLPIGLAILALLEREDGPLGTALMLGIAYAASIGGLATIIGTPPNAIFVAAVGEMFGRTIGFTQWMTIGVPLAAVMLYLTWLLLVRVLFRLPAGSSGDAAAAELVRSERKSLGPASRGEKVVGIVFALTALAWILREPKQFGAFTMPGIATYLPMVSDTTIAVTGALALFAIPVAWKKRTFALDWEWGAKLPWGVLLLFGGGLALARGFEQTGLAAWIGAQVAGFESLSLFALFAVVVTLFVYLTEMTSNTATATMGMPIMAGIASGFGADPIALMAAAALSSSMAFMLPVATPPNAIVFGSGRITIGQMMRAGWRLNLIAIALVTLLSYFVFPIVFAP